MRICSLPLVVALLAGISSGCAVTDDTEDPVAEDHQASELAAIPNITTTFVLTVSAIEGPMLLTTATGSNRCDFFSCSFPYLAGTAVTINALSANTADCLRFTSWTGACAGQGVTCHVVMNSDLSAQAQYGRIPGCVRQ